MYIYIYIYISVLTMQLYAYVLYTIVFSKWGIPLIWIRGFQYDLGNTSGSPVHRSRAAFQLARLMVTGMVRIREWEEVCR